MTLTFVDVFTLSKGDLMRVFKFGDFPNISRQIRRMAIKLALKRHLLKLAKIKKKHRRNRAQLTGSREKMARNRVKNIVKRDEFNKKKQSEVGLPARDDIEVLANLSFLLYSRRN